MRTHSHNSSKQIPARLAAAWTLLLCLPFLGGCAGLYFDDAGTPPEPPPRYSLVDLPYEEYWTGLIFNGNKIGFTHARVIPDPTSDGLYELAGHAVLHFQFLGIEKKVTLKANDRVYPDLSIERIHAEYDLDGNQLEVSAEMTPEGLNVVIESRDAIEREILAVSGKLYPSSAIALYPVIHGLEVGRSYSYEVYDGETQSISTVTQEILAYETSELFEGAAFKIRTRLHGQEVTTWMSAEGLPLLEMSMGGIFIAGLETEEMARRDLTRAALNKQDLLIDFSRVPAEPPISRPRSVGVMVVELRGLADFVLPSDSLQRCGIAVGQAKCEIRSANGQFTGDMSAGETDVSERYLRSTVTVPSRHARIRELAREIAGTRIAERERAAAIVGWIDVNIENVPVDSFSALDVLATGKAECQGHTYLYAALARSLGIPTRVVNGLVYSESFGGGFFYHTWAESLLGDQWLPIDPTFGQVGVDATHIKLLEGESLDELAPLIGLMGNLKARIIEIEHSP